MEEENIVKEDNVIVNNNNNSNNKNVIIAILVVLVILLIGVVIYLTLIKKDDKVVDNNTNNQQQQNDNQTNNQTTENNEVNNNQVTDTEQKYENNLTSDKNEESGVYGTAYVEGYAVVSEKPLCNDGPDICQGGEPTVNEVSFYVTNGKVDKLNDWFMTDENGKEYLPLGCLENNIISLGAMADEFYKGGNPNSQDNYFMKIKLDKKDSEKIIASNENNLITLRIEKKQLKKNIRMGLYRCNTMITGAEVVK